jgi:DNA invertase Pin-like site-specific DNA recombinase
MPARQLPFDGYIRVSKVNGRSGASYRSPSDQRAIIKRLAQEHGVRLGEIVQEEDVSGSKPVAERELGRLVQKVKDGQSGGLIVWNVKRYSRRMIDGLRTALDLMEAGGRIIGEDFAYEGTGATALLAMLLDQAEAEWQSRKAVFERSRDGHLDRGGYPGRAPEGYDRAEDGRLSKNGSLEGIRAAYDVRLGGGSWTKAAHALSEHGVGIGRWTTIGARNLLMRAIYKGQIGVKSDGTVVTIPALAIVTPSEWEKAQPSAGRRGRPDGGQALLSKGLLRCGGCGRALVANRTTVKETVYAYYTCRSGKAYCTEPARIKMEEAEGYLLGLAREVFLSKPGGYHAGRDRDPERITELEAAVADARREAAMRLRNAGMPEEEIPAATERLDPVRRAQDALDDELTARREALDPAAVARQLDAASLEEKRTLIGITLGPTTVLRGGGSIEERLSNPAIPTGDEPPALRATREERDAAAALAAVVAAA